MRPQSALRLFCIQAALWFSEIIARMQHLGPRAYFPTFTSGMAASSEAAAIAAPLEPNN
jgi:hypothetical protein